MKTKYFVVVAVLVTALLSFATPAKADMPSCFAQLSALSNADQIACLTDVITYLTGQITQMLAAQNNSGNQNTATSQDGGCHTFTKNLGYRESGDPEVGYLHTALALPTEGFSSGDDANTNNYTDATATAVAAFQVKYGIAPVNPANQGYFGTTTRQKMNSLYGCNVATNQNQTSATITSDSQITTSLANTNPTLTGTATISQVNVSLYNAYGDKLYGSLVSVVNGSWSVTVNQGLPYGQYTVYVYDANNNQLATKTLTISATAQDTTNNNNTSQNGTITVTSPRGGETLRTGKAYNITWTSQNLASGATVNIVLVNSVYNTNSVKQTIATNVLASAGTYSWTIPTSLSSWIYNKVEIYDASNSSTKAFSSSDFTIVNPLINIIRAGYGQASITSVEWSAESFYGLPTPANMSISLVGSNTEVQVVQSMPVITGAGRADGGIYSFNVSDDSISGDQQQRIKLCVIGFDYCVMSNYFSPNRGGSSDKRVCAKWDAWSPCVDGFHTKACLTSVCESGNCYGGYNATYVPKLLFSERCSTPAPACTPNWLCSSWNSAGPCSGDGGTQTQTCSTWIDQNHCGQSSPSASSQIKTFSCNVSDCNNSRTCSLWSNWTDCSDVGIQYKSCITWANPNHCQDYGAGDDGPFLQGTIVRSCTGNTPPACTPNWQCTTWSDWSACVNGIKTKTCTAQADQNTCGQSAPALPSPQTQSCTVTPPTSCIHNPTMCQSGTTCYKGSCTATSQINLSCNVGQKIGDVDGDGIVAENDATLAVNLAARSIVSPSNLCCADVSQDGQLGGVDASMILKILAGTAASPGVCQAPVQPTVTCSATPLSTTTGQTVNWFANITGASGGTYQWSGAATGTAPQVSTTYSTTGTKTATVTFTANGQTATANCSATITSPTPPPAQPTITVISPDSSDRTWMVGQSHWIKWTSSNLPSNAVLSIGINGDGTTSTMTGGLIASNVSASSSQYGWIVPATIGGESLGNKKYSFYATCTNCSGNVGYSSQNYVTILPAQISSTCQDSDNGDNANTAGTVTDAYGTFKDLCYAGTNQVFEYSCGATTGYDVGVWHTCQYGCTVDSNGVGFCKSAPASTSGCTTTVASDVFNVAGVATDSYGTHLDTCSGISLHKYYCSATNFYNYALDMWYTCSYGCTNGACNNAPTSLNSNNSSSLSSILDAINKIAQEIKNLK
jgi:hypothetical protein